ncbi:MAG: hypothetical protein ACI4I6_06125 [Hominimerdicola sp.]
MNNFRKSKGMIIELTSLLDVIMIMLFWVMMNVSQGVEKAEEKAQQEIDAANAQIQQEKEKSGEIIEGLENDKEQLDGQIKAMQSALDGFEDGMMLFLNLKYENGSDKLYISQNGEATAELDIDENLADNIMTELDEFADSDAVMLATVVYDGNTVLYRDMKTLKYAVENLKENYDNIYFTYINATK